MARDKQVRLHEDEKELVREVRDELHDEPTDDIPLGRVIGQIARDRLARERGGGDGG